MIYYIFIIRRIYVGYLNIDLIIFIFILYLLIGLRNNGFLFRYNCIICRLKFFVYCSIRFFLGKLFL